MPALTAAQITDLRQHPHRLGDAMYLYVFVPTEIFTAQVDGPALATVYDQSIPWKNALPGTLWSDVRRGHTLVVQDAVTLAPKGRIRIRGPGADANFVYAAEHEVILVDNDYLVVLDTFDLWHVDPFIHTDGTIYKDWNGVAPGGAISFPPGANWESMYQPVPVMGPHSVEFISTTAPLVATHSWDWTRSWYPNPNAVGLTYSAVFPGGTPASSTAPTGTVTWGTTGARWVELTVTDSQGIVAYTARRLFVTLNRDDLPDNVYLDFVPSPRIGTVDGGGFSMQFTVHVDAPESAFPDGALVIWFFDGGTQMSTGGNWPGREHIHFIGYIRKASTHKEPETGSVTFDATTLQDRMRALPMFPNFMEDEPAVSCNVWTEAVSLTVQRAAYLHMRWQTTLLEMADVIFTPAAPTTIGEHSFPEGFLYDQLNALVNRDYMYRIGCDPLSTVYFNKDPQYLTIAPATIVTISSEDWREEIDFPEPMEAVTSYVMASGNAYTPPATVAPLFSEAPGPIPLAFGRKDKSLSRLICTTQAALNTIAGMALAEANNDFPDTPVKLDGQYYIGHLFPMEFVGLDIQGFPLPGGAVTGTKRGMDLSSDLFIPRRSMLQVAYDPDGALSNALVDINVERVTTGDAVAGQDLVYPVEPPTPPTPDDGPDGGDWIPPTPPPPTPGIAGSLVASHTLGGVFWSDTRGATWETRNVGLPSTAVLDLIWDPWWFTSSRAGTSDPAYSILWACGLGFVARSGQDAGHSWTDVTPTTDPPNSWGDAIAPTAATVTYKQVHGDMTALDTFYALAEWQEAGGAWRGWIAKTTDDGVTWTWTSLAPFALIGGYYYATSWSLIGGNVNFRQPWANCIGVSNGWGYWEPEQSVDLDDTTYGQFYRGWTFAQGGNVQWAMHFGIGFTRAAGIIPIEIRMRLAGINSGLLADECRLWPDQNPNTWVAGAHQYINPGVDPVAWPDPPGAVIDRTVNMTFHDVTEYVGFRVGGFNRDTNCHLAYARIAQAYADPVGELRPLAMDVDTQDGTRLYVTVWRDGELYLENRPTATLGVVTHREDIGAATEPQVAARTMFVVPRQSHLLAAPDGNLVWVFGRWDDGTPRHISYSSAGGASPVSREDALWDATHRVGALDVFFDDQTVYAFINHAATPRLWNSIDQGVNWTNVAALPLNIEFEAEYRCTWSADEFIIGSNVAGVQMAAWNVSPYTGAWTDATGSPGLPTAAGWVSSIIWV